MLSLKLKQYGVKQHDYGVPRMVFANKMDKIGADFLYSVGTLHDRLQANADPIQLPIGSEDEFTWYH